MTEEKVMLRTPKKKIPIGKAGVEGVTFKKSGSPTEETISIECLLSMYYGAVGSRTQEPPQGTQT